MLRIVLASHGALADGMYDSLEMIVGEIRNVYVLMLLRDDKTGMAAKARSLFNSFQAHDEIIVVTDMLGSSVNNDMLTLLPEYPQMHLICGMNLPLVLSLVSSDLQLLSEDDIEELIQLSCKSVIDCNSQLIKVAATEDDDVL